MFPRTVCLLVAFVACLTSVAQIPDPKGPFAFKGNELGMSLHNFKDQNATDKIWINTGKPNAFGRSSKKLSYEVKTPLCTDEIRGFPGDVGTLAEGETLCNVSPGKANPDGLIVAGQPVMHVLYYFYNNRLYKIELYFTASHFASIAQAFVQKYGDPAIQRSRTFSNAYGARWTGQLLAWAADQQVIGLDEGQANGPGQDSSDTSHPSIGLFLDQSNLPPTAKSGLDF